MFSVVLLVLSHVITEIAYVQGGGRSVPSGALPHALVVVPNAGGASNAGGNGLSGQRCSSLNPGCSKCTPGFKGCATCQPGFKLDNGRCFTGVHVICCCIMLLNSLQAIVGVETLLVMSVMIFRSVS